MPLGNTLRRAVRAVPPAAFAQIFAALPEHHIVGFEFVEAIGSPIAIGKRPAPIAARRTVHAVARDRARIVRPPRQRLNIHIVGRTAIIFDRLNIPPQQTCAEVLGRVHSTVGIQPAHVGTMRRIAPIRAHRHTAVIGTVQADRFHDRRRVGRAHHLTAHLSNVPQCWHQDRQQQTNNRNHHQQLDQRKPSAGRMEGRWFHSMHFHSIVNTTSGPKFASPFF